jgi:protein-S-isoprenylcysteine O-methyltransferase Ste14
VTRGAGDDRLAVTPKLVAQVALFVVVVPCLPLLISRQWDWWQAWLYAAIGILSFVVSRAIAGRRHPGLLAERGRFLDHADAKSWDKRLVPLVGLGGALVPAVAGLDKLNGWSPGFGLPIELLALVALVAGYAVASYALVENAFFSGLVRIQTERGHRVVSSGPYRWVRHPGYAGSILAYLATPLLLGSAWAFVPAVALIGVLVLRTRLEDDTLQAELPGYVDYAAQVHRRLLPGVW